MARIASRSSVEMLRGSKTSNKDEQDDVTEMKRNMIDTVYEQVKLKRKSQRGNESLKSPAAKKKTTTKTKMPNTNTDTRAKKPTTHLISVALLILLHHATCEPTMDNQNLSAPLITKQPQDIMAFEGESAELSCEALGQPEPQIEWFHNERLVSSLAKPSVQIFKNTLRFHNLPPQQAESTGGNGNSLAGQYHCLATNSLGQVRSRNATLKILSCK